MSNRHSLTTRRPALGRAAPKYKILSENVREYKRDLVLSAAVEVFYERGYQNATVDEVAAALSMSKSLVYNNFGAKSELLEGIVDRVQGEMLIYATNLDMGLPPPERLANLCYYHTAFTLKHQKAIAIVFRERRNFSAEFSQTFKKRQDKVIGTFIKTLDEGVACGDFRAMDTELVAFQILGMIGMIFDWQWHRDRERLSQGALSRDFAEQALRLAGYAGEFTFHTRDLALGSGGVITDPPGGAASGR